MTVPRSVNRDMREVFRSEGFFFISHKKGSLYAFISDSHHRNFVKKIKYIYANSIKQRQQINVI